MNKDQELLTTLKNMMLNQSFDKRTIFGYMQWALREGDGFIIKDKLYMYKGWIADVSPDVFVRFLFKETGKDLVEEINILEHIFQDEISIAPTNKEELRKEIVEASKAVRHMLDELLVISNT